MELKEQLEVEEEDGDRQEEEVEVERERASQGECAMCMTVSDYECAQDLSHEVCVYHHEAVGTKMRVQCQCMYATRQLKCRRNRVNVVIGVVLGELHVVRVVPVVVCDDAVVRRTLVLIAFHDSHCFHVGFP